MRGFVGRISLGLATGLLVVVAANCTHRDNDSDSTYYDRKIAPLLTGSCATSPSGSLCHVTADARGNALGNLDVTSYEMLAKRRDLLTPYGSYPAPQLLVKVLPPDQLLLTAWDGTSELITTAVAHAGGSILDPSAAATAVLTRWIERGATQNNAEAPRKSVEKEACVDRIGKDPLFDPDNDPPGADYAEFVSEVNDWLVSTCAGKNCHGAPEGAFPLSCGVTPQQKRWNYFSASDYVAVDPSASELLRRPLNPAYGGTYHEGGTFFDSTDDERYKALANWVSAKGGPTNVPSDAGFDFFAKRVQPMLVKKGCVLLGCHSAPSFSDFKPRGGSGGHFGLSTTRDNYHALLKMAALESPDPNASRFVRKNLPPGPQGRGIRHRGGSLFAEGGDPGACDLSLAESGPLDQQDPYCVVTAWLAKERADRTKSLAPLSGIVYVRRPPAQGSDHLQDFEGYSPGADLRRVDASLDAQGKLVVGGQDQSLLAGCGLGAASADVRRPQISWDGKRLAFAARSAQSEPLRIYTANADGSSCALEPTIDAPAVDDQGNPVADNGELVHDFDPTFAPDGAIVFASTRGNVRSGAEFPGPRRSTADPSKLNANLYVLENGKIRQLTFLTNQELEPVFKTNGQLLFTTEKRAPGFYQLAARRINLDGGDYHPLFGQRGTIGYNQLTGIVQLADLDFAAIVSDRGAAHQAGALAIVNRSIGPDNASPNTDDYSLDPDAADYAKTAFFQHSLTLLEGAYRSPSALPNGDVLVSHAANVIDLTAFNGNFDVVVIDPSTQARTPLPALSDPASDEIWAVAVFGRVDRGVFRSTPADPTGSAVVYTEDDDQKRVDRAELTFLDFPMISSLMFQSTRSGRQIVDEMDSFELWESLPPEGETSLDAASPFIAEDQYGKLYVRRRRIGSVPLESDGSTRLQVPGGMPLIFGVLAELAGESGRSLHHQREETQYYPGEWVTLSFRRDLFNHFCGGCHGPTSGQETDVSLKPDLLTQASKAIAKEKSAKDLVGATAGPIQGPPFP